MLDKLNREHVLKRINQCGNMLTVAIASRFVTAVAIATKSVLWAAALGFVYAILLILNAVAFSYLLEKWRQRNWPPRL